MKRVLKSKSVWALLVLITYMYVNNASFFVEQRSGEPLLLAHRGLAQTAFDAGADIVEFDVHITKDDQFAVFLDWMIDCRTNASGVTRDYTMAELKKLDIGFGYTADHGNTHPFRGIGIGLMPSLVEVLTHFP